MKKTRLFAFILAGLTALTFASCSAGHDLDAGAPELDGNNNYFPDVDQSIPNSGEAAPEYDVDMDAAEEMVGSVATPDAEEENKPIEGTNAADGEVTTKTEEEDTAISTPENNRADLITVPFTKTEENNFSTFSADVDTASYTYFRKLVNSGYSWNDLRQSGSVFRTEEFINYFRYDVPKAREGELFGTYTEMTPCPWTNGETMLFRLTLEAPEAPESAGNNLVFLIDVSGSMSSSDKLPLLKKAFSYLVGNLGANDRVSIVTYSGKEAVVLDGCRGGNTAEIMDAINSLRASGSTNGEAGLTMAYQIAEKHMIEGGNNRIIMASDGDLNVGISSSSELKSYIEQKRDQGVYLSVLGFGMGNYKDEKMEALADNGNGVYYYIDGESEAEKVFGTDLMGTLYTVANDVKLQIEFNEHTVESYRLIGYDNRVLDKDDFENDAKDAGDVGAGHQVTVLYEIALKAQPEGDVISELMTFRVRYKNPGETLSRLNEYVLGQEIIINEPSAETSFIISVTELASLLRNPEYNGDVTVQTIAAALSQMDLSKSEMVEFCEIVESLAK